MLRSPCPTSGARAGYGAAVSGVPVQAARRARRDSQCAGAPKEPLRGFLAGLPRKGLTPCDGSGTHNPSMENSFGKPVEVEVRDSLEKAMKILKTKMSKEGILQELKRRRFYEKPSVKKKRKTREARKRLRREMKRRVMPAPTR
jgi:small subunit ribosomal protein S21